MPEQNLSEPLRPDLGALWRHRALVVAVLYAFVALVGALYYALLLGQFGLNAFHYWEASDFLLAAFREPIALGFGLVAVALYFSFTRAREMNDLFFGRHLFIRRLLRYDRWRESRLMSPQFGPLSSMLLTLLWFVIVLGSMADLAASKARGTRGDAVRYALESGALQPAQLLTTTNRFVFLVVPGAAPRDARLLAIPVDALVELEHCGARRGGLRALLRGSESCDAAAPAAVAPTAPTPPVAAPASAVTTPTTVAP